MTQLPLSDVISQIREIKSGTVFEVILSSLPGFNKTWYSGPFFTRCYYLNITLEHKLYYIEELQNSIAAKDILQGHSGITLK